MKRAFTVLLAALAVAGCGDSGNSGPTSLTRPQDPADQLEWGQNTARVGGISPADVAGASVLAAYPPVDVKPPSTWFLVRDDQWRQAALAAQFGTDPIHAVSLVYNKDYLPTATVDLLSQLKAGGFPKTKGLDTVVMGKASTDVFVDLDAHHLGLTQFKQEPAKLSEKLVPLHGGGAGRYTSNIVVASGDERDYALPAAAWSAYSGDTLVFAGHDSIPEATRHVVSQREALRLERPTIYVIGPEKVISDSVVDELSAYGEVKRVGGPSAVETSIELARYHDAKTLFGWGLREGPGSFSLVNTKNWGNAVGAWTFAATGPQAPLLLTDSSDRLPGAVTDYLNHISSDQPSQGFVFGDRDSISSNEMRQFDRALGAR